MWIICFLIIHISIAFLFSFSFSRSDTPSGGGRSGQEVYQSKRLHRRRERSAVYEESPPYDPLFSPIFQRTFKMSGGCGGEGGMGDRG